jgi:hypothetical protein
VGLLDVNVEGDLHLDVVALDCLLLGGSFFSSSSILGVGLSFSSGGSQISSLLIPFLADHIIIGILTVAVSSTWCHSRFVEASFKLSKVWLANGISGTKSLAVLLAKFTKGVRIAVVRFWETIFVKTNSGGLGGEKGEDQGGSIFVEHIAIVVVCL